VSRIKTAVNLLKRDPKKIFPALGRNGVFNWMPDKLYLKIIYYYETGQYLNLDNPVTFNEKLQWIKLYDRKPEYNTYVDKYNVRDYIKQTLGEEYLIPLIGVYDTVDEIPWDELPNKFVLKCTHGSGSNIICKDKCKLDIEESKRKLKRWMKKNWFWFGREWPYKNVKPRIICEEFISDTNNTPDDIKVLCFNGKAKLIEVHMNRFGNNHTQDFYDITWRKTGISQGNISNSTKEKPLYFEEMINLSELLAKDKYHVRIDWYEVNGKLYFGEITFFDGSGLYPFDNENDNLMLGSWIDLTMK
jgi:hypothetical protein